MMTDRNINVFNKSRKIELHRKLVYSVAM